MQGRELKPAYQADRIWTLILDAGEDPVECIESFASQHHIAAASITAIGAFERATIGWFDWEQKRYHEIDIDEQVEVLSLIGDIALKDDEPSLHAHVVLGKRDGSAHGGHLLSASVRPTMEIILTDTPTHLRKRHDDESGLALISTT